MRTARSCGDHAAKNENLLNKKENLYVVQRKSIVDFEKCFVLIFG